LDEAYQLGNEERKREREGEEKRSQLNQLSISVTIY